MSFSIRVLLPAAALATLASACAQPATIATTTPVYSKSTGKLEQLVADRDADGKPDARAFMDGATLKRIEIDRNHDGRPDRWETYASPAPGTAGPGAPAQITLAEEANGSDSRVTRRENYQNGEIEHVQEDTDLDGRMDKWETYRDRRLAYVDLDIEGTGSANRRLTYAADGSVTSAPVPKEVAL
jgi:hypothetical protein